MTGRLHDSNQQFIRDAIIDINNCFPDMNLYVRFTISAADLVMRTKSRSIPPASIWKRESITTVRMTIHISSAVNLHHTDLDADSLTHFELVKEQQVNYQN